MRAWFSRKLYFKSEFKKSRSIFFSSQILLAEKTKQNVSGKPGFQLKAGPLEAFLVIFGRGASFFSL